MVSSTLWNRSARLLDRLARRAGSESSNQRAADIAESTFMMLLPDNHQNVRARACHILSIRLAKKSPKGVASAQRETGPDRGTEIERHPGDLVLPLSELVRHDPTNARITKALQRAQRSDALGNPGSPSREIHRDIDGRQKRQIAGN